MNNREFMKAIDIFKLAYNKVPLYALKRKKERNVFKLDFLKALQIRHN